MDLRHLLTNPLIIKICCVTLALLTLYEIQNDLQEFIEIYQISNHQILRQQPQSQNHIATPTGLSGNLFGNVLVKHLSDSSIRQSLLKIKLVGLAFSSDENASEVIINLSSGKEHIYHIGDVMPDGVKIVRINQDGIVIERDGNLEKVLLPKIE